MRATSDCNIKVALFYYICPKINYYRKFKPIN